MYELREDLYTSMYEHAGIFLKMYEHEQKCMNTCMNMCMDLCMDICMNICMNICINMYGNV